MNIFELHFNPPPKNPSAGGSVDLALDTFCFEPKNIHEKRFGSLYMAGEIRNLLPKNTNLLNNIAQTIKDRFYATSIHSPEKAIENSLKRTNEFLAEELSKDNISWLGNLNFAVIYLKPRDPRKLIPKNGFALNYTKVGTVKVILLRNGEIIDIGKNLDMHDIEPYPLKVFTNTISSQLLSGDKILVFTKEIFDFFKKEGLLNKLAVVRAFDESKIKNITKPQEKILSEISGIMLLIDTEKEILQKPSIMTFNKELEHFSLKEVFAPIANLATSLYKKILISKRKSVKPRRREDKKKTKKVIAKKLITQFNYSNALKNNVVLVIIFAILLGIGFLTFQQRTRKDFESKIGIIVSAKEKILDAEKFFESNNEAKARELFKEALGSILLLTSEPRPIKESLDIKNQIESSLKEIDKFENIENPVTIFEIDQKEFIPQKIIYSNDNIFLFTILSNKVYKFNTANSVRDVYNIDSAENEKPSLATTAGNTILFFLKPNKIVSFQDNSFKDYLTITTSLPDAEPTVFAFYQNSIYLLSKDSGEIIKYQKDENKESLWLNSNTKKATDGRSMAIDGSIWILRDNNTISRYYNGQHQEDISLDFFPWPKTLSKITTSAFTPYLYILEPSQNRVIIIEKNGKIIKQLQSDKFNNLKDIAVAPDGLTIYLLNGQTIYKANL